MEREKREALAERCLRFGALAPEPGAETPLRWMPEKALEREELRSLLTGELAELVREHYSAGEGVLGDEWAELTAAALGLSAPGDALPSRPILIVSSAEDAEPYLPRLIALRERGGSPGIAAVWNRGEEALRLRLDRADIRCHWLLDLESAAAAALRLGLLDFEDYCRIFPQD